ncbi:hypothetical protein AAMO2058_000063200 [Amorphochlora amoebiformis]
MPTILPSKRPAELSGTSRKLVNKKRRLRAQESIVPSRWMKGTVEKYKNGHPDGESAGKNLHRLRRVSKMAASVPMPKEVLLAGDRPTKIGRLQESDLCLDSKITRGMISRRHARLIPNDQGTHTLIDESKNGCYINGTRVKHQDLKLDDVIVFGGPTDKKVGDFCCQLETEFAYMYESRNKPKPHPTNELAAMYDRYADGKALPSSVVTAERSKKGPTLRNRLKSDLPELSPDFILGSSDSHTTFTTNSDTTTSISGPMPVGPWRHTTPPLILPKPQEEEEESLYDRILKLSEAVGALTTIVGIIAGMLEGFGFDFQAKFQWLGAIFGEQVHEFINSRWAFPALILVLVTCVFYTIVAIINALKSPGTMFIEDATFYFRFLRRSQAERMLLECGSGGIYLLRPSESSVRRTMGPGVGEATLYVISSRGFQEGPIKHTKMWRIDAGPKFFPNVGATLVAPDTKRVGCRNVELFVERYVSGISSPPYRPYTPPS